MLDLSFYENFKCFLSHFYFLSSTGGRSDTACRTGFSADFSNFFMFPVYLNLFLSSFSFLPKIMSDQHYFSGKDDRWLASSRECSLKATPDSRLCLHLAVLFIFVRAFVECRLPFVPIFFVLCLCFFVKVFVSICFCSVRSRDGWIDGCVFLVKRNYSCFDPNEIFLTFLDVKRLFEPK